MQRCACCIVDLPELAHAARGRLSFAKDGAARVREMGR